VPWARRYTAATAARHGLDLDDAWSETLTALLRAAVYFRPGAGTFAHYASRAVVRALWRYGARSRHRRPTVPLESVAAELPALPSAEDEVLAADAIRRAVILRQHEQLAIARADHDTATRLHAAAATAERFARHRIRPPRPA
jgi:hypothetical protein